MKKRVLCLLFSLCLICLPFAGCGDSPVNAQTAATRVSARSRDVLKIYTWSDYQYENLENDFNQYYRMLSGNPNFNVQFTFFSTAEEMLTKIETGKEDFDLACPSDYIIQQMMTKKLLLPIDTSKLNNYANLSDFIVQKHNEFEADVKSPDDQNTYSVSYMWGTMGILYNTKVFEKEQLQNGWDAFFDPENRGKVLIKDSMRDTYVMAAIQANKDVLKSYTPGTQEYLNKVTEIINNVDNDNLTLVEAILKQMKSQVKPAFEVDEGKSFMAKGDFSLNFAWSGDAIWAIQEAFDNKIQLAYLIPKIGSNIWFDGWVIPKYAQNLDAAHAFIDFVLQSDVAIKNMDYIGYTSGVATREVAEWLSGTTDDGNHLGDGIGYENDIDLSYFFGNKFDATHLRIPSFMYPSSEDISVCAIMKNFGDRTSAVATMWSRLKSGAGSMTTVLIVLFSVIAAGMIAFFIFHSVIPKLKKKKKKDQKQLQAYRRQENE